MQKVQKASSQLHSREKEAERPKTPEAWLPGNDRKSYPQLDILSLLTNLPFPYLNNLIFQE